MIVIGIAGLYHDSSAAVLVDGKIVAAAQEERFTRVKNDASLPVNAIKYCLDYMEMKLEEADAVVYYDNPILTLDRFIRNVRICGEDSKDLLRFQYDEMFQEKLLIHKLLEKEFGKIGKIGKLIVANHHMSHAASAFYPSPFKKAAILTLDGVGEWNSLTIGVGVENKIKLLKKIDYPHSLGMLYAAFTHYCGFKVNSGEYKLMGLAPYGQPIYRDLILEKLIDVKEDGSFRMNLEYFDYQFGRTMINHKFEELFGKKKRQPESKITRFYMDIAASIQVITEEIVIKLAKTATKITGINDNLVLAGGIALNCVANGKLHKEKIFENIWIQPAAGDAGGAVGAAFLGYFEYLKQDSVKENNTNGFYNTYLGPEYTDVEIESFLKKNQIKYFKSEVTETAKKIGNLINENKIIGLFQGRMEFGPRALGNRSIIANAKGLEMQADINMKIKFRESFRPFAPAVLAEDMKEYFDIDVESPYMLLCAPLRKDICYEFNVLEEMDKYNGDMIQVSRIPRSEISAVTHVDFSARVQSVTKESNLFFYNVINEYKKISGCSVIVNTSFNVRGEPIVCTPEDAYLCFMRTNMDVLVLGNFILYKEEQSELKNDINWRDKYELD